MRYRALVLVLFAAFILSSCNLGRDDDTSDEDITNPIVTIDPGGQPVVEILSPDEGDEFVVNDPILISVRASDNVGVTSVQLFANGDVVRTVSSESPTGDTAREFLLDYTPRTQGDIELEVVALRNSIRSEPDLVNVVVRSTQSQVIATPQQSSNIPVINPNDPTCRALVNARLNFRRGPDTSFGIIRVLDTGELLPVVGRLPDNTWWQVSSSVTIGWVAQEFITLYGICSSVAAVNLATATSNAPTATALPTETGIPPTNTAIPTDAPSPTPATPDLAVTNITGPSEIIIPSGQDSITERYSVNITNLGGAVNTQFSTVARLLPSGDNFDVGVAAALSAGQSINLTFDVTFDTAGSFALQVTSDDDNVITEDNESNNSGLVNVTVERKS